MTQDAPRPDGKAVKPKAKHGSPTEVTWDGGKGRQPYPNQESTPDGGPAAAHEFEAGDRGELSGRNQEQMEQVRKKP